MLPEGGVCQTRKSGAHTKYQFDYRVGIFKHVALLGAS